MFLKYFKYPFVKYGLVLYLFLLSLSVVLFDYIKSKYVFPISEGWWETYSWLLANGSDIYQNYHIQFPPLYIRLISTLSNLFDGNMLEIRFALAALHFLTFLIFIAWIKKFVNLKSAVTAAGVACALVMANPVYFPKDYHTLVEFLLILILYLIVGPFSSFRTFLAALMIGALLLVKQNIGIFFGISIFIFLLTKLNTAQVYARIITISSFIVGTLTFPIVYSIIYSPTWLVIFLGNDSKGGVSTVLFRFITDRNSLVIVFTAIFISSIFFLFNKFQVKYKNIDSGKINIGNLLTVNDNKLFQKFTRLILFILVLSTFYKLQILYALSLSWAVSRIWVYEIFGKNARFKEIAFPLIGLAYCGTQTAGFNSVSMEFLIGLFLAEVSWVIVSDENSIFNKRVFQFSMLIPFAIIINSLFQKPSYNWWGLSSESVVRNEYFESDFKELKGIYLDRFMSNVLEYVSFVKKDINSNDVFLATPSIPYFYQLLEIKPRINPILWFDVTSSKDVQATEKFIKEFKPKYIFNLQSPINVYDGHFLMRKRDPAIFFMDQTIRTQVISGNYFVEFVEFPWHEYEKIISVNKPVHLKAFNQCIKLTEYCNDAANYCSLFKQNQGLSESCEFDAKNEYFARKFIKTNKAYVEYPGFIFYGLKRVN